MLSAPVIQEFMLWLEKERNCAVATVMQRLACIRSFFSYAGKIDVSLIERQNELGKIVVKKKRSSPLVEFLSENALKTVLEEPDTSTSKGIRDMFYMIMLYDSGARNRELLNLRLCDITLTPNHSHIQVTGKGDRCRVIPIMEKTAEHCKKYLGLFHPAESDKSQYLFYTIRQGVKQQMSDDNVARFLKSYGISAKEKCSEVPKNIHPHLFRHTRAMHLYRGGMPLALIAEWLGHAQLETTLVYAHADTEMKRLAIQKATNTSNPVRSVCISDGEWKNDEDLIRELYGLK
jgi:site-specific recombinase XerD